MEEPRRRWVLLVSARRARLVQCSVTPRGRCRVTEVDCAEMGSGTLPPGCGLPICEKLTAASEVEKEHGDEQIGLFMRQVAEWLGGAVQKLQIADLAVFGAGRFLQVLREACPAPLQGIMEEHHGNLAYCCSGALSRHPKIIALMRFSSPERSLPG